MAPVAVAPADKRVADADIGAGENVAARAAAAFRRSAAVDVGALDDGAPAGPSWSLVRSRSRLLHWRRTARGLRLRASYAGAVVVFGSRSLEDVSAKSSLAKSQFVGCLVFC